MHGDLPNLEQLREFDARLRRSRAIPEPLVTLLGQVPEQVHPMDTLRSAVSVLSHFDPDVNAAPTDHAANVRKAERMIAQMATAVAYRRRLSKGLPLVPPRDDLDHAANFLYMVSGKVPSSTMREAFDLSMVLYTEHELNASTFAARVTVSTLSDIYSGIVAAIGTLKGPLHGGANEEAWKVLERVGSPEKAEAWIQDALARKERIMGFGHRVYKTGDPRAAILKKHCIALAKELGEDRWERIAEPIEQAVTTQKNLPPNVDWPTPGSITTWAWRSSCTPRSSPWPASPAGRPTSSSSSITTGSCGPGRSISGRPTARSDRSSSGDPARPASPAKKEAPARSR